MSEPPPRAVSPAEAQRAAARLRGAIAEVMVGQASVLDQVLWALFAGGHVLLEGAPGLGKTLLVRTLASAVNVSFSRIQFTPDLMPSDITGTNVLVLDAAGRATGHFELHRGPLFGQVVLADEINRATPKTQSALLEAMQEHAITIAGKRHVLEEPFFVLATQNPIEMEGTYPLPEAQLDRFLLHVLVPTPTEDEITEVLSRTTSHELVLPEPVLDRVALLELRHACRAIVAPEPVARYAARLVGASSPDSSTAPELVGRAVRYGAGVRGAQAMVLAAKAVALLDGRPSVAFDDIARVAAPCLRHRILRSFEGEADGIGADAIIEQLLGSVPRRSEPVEHVVQEA